MTWLLRRAAATEDVPHGTIAVGLSVGSRQIGHSVALGCAGRAAGAAAAAGAGAAAARTGAPRCTGVGGGGTPPSEP